MSTLEDVRNGVKNTIKDSSITDEEVDSVINMALQFISESVRLPVLDSEGTFTTDPTKNSVDIPVLWNYQRGLYRAFSATTDQEVSIAPSLDFFRRRFGPTYALQQGAVVGAVVIGGHLHYFRSPGSPESIVCRFFRKPAVMVDDSDQPEGLPAGLAKPLLESYVLSWLYNRIEDGVEGKKSNTIFYRSIFDQYLNVLDANFESGQPSPEPMRNSYRI